METALRAALIAWLQSDPALAGAVNLIDEEATSRASLPWLALVASASADWSVKDRIGREVRVAFELNNRSDSTSEEEATLAMIETRIGTLPPVHPTFTIITAQFLRARSERRPDNIRASLLEYRFRVLAHS